MINSPTLKLFIQKALIPVGHTMYVYGGGWNEEDTLAGIEATSIGEASAWRKFFATQGTHYNFRNFMHCSSLGLDCTGYIGWAIYNLFNTQNNLDGYVFESRVLGYRLEEMGLGSVTEAQNVTNHRCGDIFFSPVHRHAYIALGEFCDKSVALLHSSPPGVMLSGTPSPYGIKSSLAQKCAKRFMQKKHPEWTVKFPCCDRGMDYLQGYHRFRFFKVVVSDPEGICTYTPQEILSYIA